MFLFSANVTLFSSYINARSCYSMYVDLYCAITRSRIVFVHVAVCGFLFYFFISSPLVAGYYRQFFVTPDGLLVLEKAVVPVVSFCWGAKSPLYCRTRRRCQFGCHEIIMSRMPYDTISFSFFLYCHRHVNDVWN